MSDSRTESVLWEESRRPAEADACDLDVWLRRGCALLVAGVAGYASYVHQRHFAVQGGADEVSASLWPLSVDGLLLLATVGLLKSSASGRRGGRERYAVWLAFLLGIAVSLAANIAAAPALAWKPVLVAGWPPVALLLSVELLAHRAPTGAVRAPLSYGTRADGDGDGNGLLRDPLLERARRVDAEHRELHQRPVSAESLRRELRIGAERSRQLVASVRADREGSRRERVLGPPMHGPKARR
ncbi:DUF2637 domain-containing protein [Streptomyces sp. NPDC091217]|uniref:DUF2637 domain-containing protein n=1 Tax=Streptomyces sp. NPDC091217 TaxID=3365975 RepID=UPI00381663DE